MSPKSTKAEFRHLADGRQFTVRVTPKAARAHVWASENGQADLKVSVTVVPEGGKANTAVVALLAQALGVPKSRLTLLRGAVSRDKVFQVT